MGKTPGNKKGTLEQASANNKMKNDGDGTHAAGLDQLIAEITTTSTPIRSANMATASVRPSTSS